MKSLKKNKNTFQSFENIVVFPGTSERLIAEGHHYAGIYKYDEAVKCIEEALQYVEGDEPTLSVYAYALYETRQFEKAKAVCEQLLSIGPKLYFEAMEFYLTICMQLKDFEQAKKLIEALLEEGVVPPDRIEKFERLQKMNAEISENVQLNEEVEVIVEINPELYSLEQFVQSSAQQQAILLQELAETNIRNYQDSLKAIIEHGEIHPFVQSLALILLVEQEVNIELTITKLGERETVNAASLKLPTELPQFKKVYALVHEKLEQEPTTLEMADYLLARHSIVTYPFEWLTYDSEDVASSYIDYVKTLFGEVKEMDYEIIEFLQTLENLSELQEI